ncbi:hypothetical protein Gogos_005461 [Gossypium gossypioides]|uniref:RNase H type-1 domain-containing protein n=1 Tax=Gossypium gossypioides TaxID=34282 RepID=A0A7J9D5W1_GOSGO|nr:hypothetical protein [Gossypium gossypioides]
MEEKKLILVGSGDSKTDVNRMNRSVYFDAAFDQQHARSASGLIVQGEGGEIMATKSVIHNNIATPFAAEAHAGLKALELGRSMGFTDLQILGDSKTIIRKCQSSEQDRSIIGAIINDIQEIKTRSIKERGRTLPGRGDADYHPMSRREDEAKASRLREKK